jgi:hypothetical protein
VTERVTLDTDALRSLLTAVRDTSWSWTEDGVPALAERLGWALVEVLPGLGAVADAGYGLGAKAFRLNFDEGAVWKVTMRISSRVAEHDPADQALLEGVFAAVREVGAEVFGRPASPFAGTVPQVRWRGARTTLAVRNPGVAVALTWMTNAQQDVIDAIEAAEAANGW